MEESFKETSYKELLKEGLVELRTLRKKVENFETKKSEPIAIIGIGCKLPNKANNHKLFWEFLKAEKSSVSKIPEDRWNIEQYYAEDRNLNNKIYTRYGNFIDKIDKFDSSFFGLSPRESKAMDPQQRILMEVTLEALEDAGLNLKELNNSPCGVFIGIGSHDYADVKGKTNSINDGYFATGNASSAASGRLSYFLGLTGPSMSIDTACSSSLVALHLACQSLRQKEVDVALSGGVNLILSPEVMITLSKANMLAVDGQCKTFDASADGYGRGEGCGVLVLKRLSDAEANGDHILAVIKGTAVNQDGSSGGLTVPNGLSQQEVIRSALSNAGLLPSDISYIEAHGTGTPLGDPIEVEAIDAVYCKERAPNKPLIVGSVKSNIGHLESAAGIAGLIKVILSLKHQQIPGNINFNEPNSHIDWDKFAIKVPVGLMDWESDGKRAAGVSSFGFSGTNAHVIIEEYILETIIEPKNSESADHSQQLLCLSAKTEKSLELLKQKYKNYLTDSNTKEGLIDICNTAVICRTHFRYRLTAKGANKKEMAAILYQERIQTNYLVSGNQPKIAFLFTGQGSQYSGMCKELYESESFFRKEIDLCEELLKNHMDIPLTEILFSSKESKLIDRTEYTQPALFSIEYALARLWMNWGVTPDILVGHSVGEYVAACISGVFSIDDALSLIAVRGKLMGSLPYEGSMINVYNNFGNIQDMVASYEGLNIAAINSSHQVVVSGRSEAIARFSIELKEQGIHYKMLNVSHAFHSELMHPILNDFFNETKKVNYSHPKIDVISNLTGKIVGTELSNAEYWRDHIKATVNFHQSMEVLQDQNCELHIEIGPRAVLANLIKQNDTLTIEENTILHSIDPNTDNRNTLLDAIEECYLKGVVIDWNKYAENTSWKRTLLPNYAFDHKRYWIEAKDQQLASMNLIVNEKAHPLLGQKLDLAGEEIIYSNLVSELPEYLNDHKVFDKIIFPAAGFLEMALAVGCQSLGTNCIVLENVDIPKALILNDTVSKIQTVVREIEENHYEFRIVSSQFDKEKNKNQWIKHASGVFKKLSDGDMKKENIINLQEYYKTHFDTQELYELYEDRGIVYGPNFKSLTKISTADDGAIGLVELPNNLLTANYQFHPVLLDGSFQVLAATIGKDAESGDTFLPTNMERFEYYGGANKSIWSDIKVGAQSGSNQILIDIGLIANDGEKIGSIKGLHLKKVNKDLLGGASTKRNVSDWLYQLAWEANPLNDHKNALDDSIDIKALALEVKNHFDRQIDHEPLNSYKEILVDLEYMSIGYIIHNLYEMGFEFVIGMDFTISIVMEQLGIIESYTRLTARIFDILSEEGLFSKQGNQLKVEKKPNSNDYLREPENISKSSAEYILLERCGTNLKDVLRGEKEAVSLLFPEGDTIITTELYENSSEALVMNQLIKEVIKRIIDKIDSGKKIRILEIGAGTGGTTSHILPLLNSESSIYEFTDISPLFLSKAEEKFKEFDFVNYKFLDLEKSPIEQGFKTSSYDIVLASNVIHATKDLSESIENIKELLNSNGLLILLEGAIKQRFLDLTFGLTEGWWRFNDSIRTTYPLLSASNWITVLEEQGFDSVSGFPEKKIDLLNQTIILAQGYQKIKECKKATKQWVVFSDQQGVGNSLSEVFTDNGIEYTLVFARNTYSKEADHYAIDINKRSDYESLFEEIVSSGKEIAGIVYLCSIDIELPIDNTMDESLRLGNIGVLNLIQTIGEYEELRQISLYINTLGSQFVTEGFEITGLFQSPLWGMGKVISLEYPELKCICMDLDPSNIGSASEQIYKEISNNNSNEHQIAYRSDIRYVNRLVNDSLSHKVLELPESESYKLEITEVGSTDGLELISNNREVPKDDEVEVRVEATGLNFRDVLLTLGGHIGTSLTDVLGGEFSGEIVRLGANVKTHKLGDRVVGLASGSFKKYITTTQKDIIEIPSNLSFAEAASIPSNFLTAYYVLHKVVKIKPKDKILIHSAAGGTGLALVQLAQQSGAEVFTTSSVWKQEYLRSQGVKHLHNSRNLDFASEISKKTKGKGIDIVINSLVGEFIPKGMELLEPKGQFIEIGKTEIWTDEQVKNIREDILYKYVDLVEITQESPALIMSILKTLFKDFKNKKLQPVPIKLFPIERTKYAFRFMQQAKHIGKLVVTHSKDNIRNKIKPNETYLITGGVNGLGLLSAQWLSDHGANKIVLISRSKPKSDAISVIEKMQKQNIEIITVKCDVTDLKAMSEVIKNISKNTTLKGVIHAAGVLDDGVLSSQNENKFSNVMAPKVLGSWNLHLLTKGLDLDFFILYSSAASLLGSPGQANHSSANAFLDSLAHYRDSLNLPATSINWGAWSEVGSAAFRESDKKSVNIKGIDFITPKDGLKALEIIVKDKYKQVGVIPIDWKTFNTGDSNPYYKKLRNKEGDKNGKKIFIYELNNASKDKQEEILKKYIQEQLANILGIDEFIESNMDLSFFDLGMDSLTSMELKNVLEKNLKISLSSTFIFDYPTTAKLKEYISKELFDIRIENIDDNKELEPLIENEEISSLIDDLTQYTNE